VSLGSDVASHHKPTVAACIGSAFTANDRRRLGDSSVRPFARGWHKITNQRLANLLSSNLWRRCVTEPVTNRTIDAAHCCRSCGGGARREAGSSSASLLKHLRFAAVQRARRGPTRLRNRGWTCVEELSNLPALSAPRALLEENSTIPFRYRRSAKRHHLSETVVSGFSGEPWRAGGELMVCLV
jgi:hypothetical protein